MKNEKTFEKKSFQKNLEKVRILGNIKKKIFFLNFEKSNIFETETTIEKL